MIWLAVLFLVVLMSWRLLCFYRAFGGDPWISMESGAYMSLTWKFEHFRMYQLYCKSVLLTLCLCMLVALIYILITSQKVFELLSSNLPDVVIAVISVTSLLSDKTPTFDFYAPEFKAICFVRPWSCFMENNDAFAQRLNKAVLQAGAGQPNELQSMLADPRSIDAMLAIYQTLSPHMLSASKVAPVASPAIGVSNASGTLSNF